MQLHEPQAIYKLYILYKRHFGHCSSHTLQVELFNITRKMKFAAVLLFCTIATASASTGHSSFDHPQNL